MIHAQDLQRNLDETFELETPENIELTYTLAGIGSRFAATVIDTSLLVIIMLLNVLLFLVVLARRFESISETATYTLIAIWALLTLLLFWGYYIVFETAWNGQTPGKRLFHLRVLRSTGYPVTLADVTIRNLVRAIDLLPSFYGFGVVSMMVTKRAQRLGDLAAGTVVVKDQKRISLADLGIDLRDLQPTALQQPGQQPATLPAPASNVVAPLQEPSTGRPPEPPPAPAGLVAPTLPNLDHLRPEDFQTIRSFFERAGRNEIRPDLINNIGRRLAQALATRIGYRGQLYTDTQCAEFLHEILRNERR